jgi:hypothetical protein
MTLTSRSTSTSLVRSRMPTPFATGPPTAREDQTLCQDSLAWNPLSRLTNRL